MTPAEIAAQLKAAAITASETETNYLLELAGAESDPERVWAAGDPNLTFDEFLEVNELCDPRVYRAFAAGFSAVGSVELALFVGHEAVSYTAEMASPDQVASLIEFAKRHRDQHGVVADRSTLRRAMGHAR